MHREVHIARARVNTDKRRALFLARLNELKGQPCADCGICYLPYVMDFDHVHGDKIEEVCNLRRRLVRWERIIAEIEKCEVVCANCHRTRTYLRLHA